MCTSGNSNVFGNLPVNIKWEISRGDTQSLLVEFLEDDETTPWDTELWDFVASAYDPSTDSVEELEVEVNGSAVTINIPEELSIEWGTGYGKVVLQLPFDLKVTTPDNDIWTAISGTIIVNSDVSSGL